MTPVKIINNPNLIRMVSTEEVETIEQTGTDTLLKKLLLLSSEKL